MGKLSKNELDKIIEEAKEIAFQTAKDYIKESNLKEVSLKECVQLLNEENSPKKSIKDKLKGHALDITKSFVSFLLAALVTFYCFDLARITRGYQIEEAKNNIERISKLTEDFEEISRDYRYAAADALKAKQDSINKRKIELERNYQDNLNDQYNLIKKRISRVFKNDMITKDTKVEFLLDRSEKLSDSLHDLYKINRTITKEFRAIKDSLKYNDLELIDNLYKIIDEKWNSLTKNAK